MCVWFIGMRLSSVGVVHSHTQCLSLNHDAHTVAQALQAAHSCVPFVNGAGQGARPMGHPYTQADPADSIPTAATAFGAPSAQHQAGIPGEGLGAVPVDPLAPDGQHQRQDALGAGSSVGWLQAHAMAHVLTRGSAALAQAEEALALLLHGTRMQVASGTAPTTSSTAAVTSSASSGAAMLPVGMHAGADT
jgi:hypothetical protein